MTPKGNVYLETVCTVKSPLDQKVWSCAWRLICLLLIIFQVICFVKKQTVNLFQCALFRKCRTLLNYLPVLCIISSCAVLFCTARLCIPWVRQGRLYSLEVCPLCIYTCSSHMGLPNEVVVCPFHTRDWSTSTKCWIYCIRSLFFHGWCLCYLTRT